MIDGGHLIVAGPTESLLERTGVLTVDVGDGRDRLVAALQQRGLTATAIDDTVEVAISDEGQIDVVRDTVAELTLPLYRLSSRLTSLDEVFLRQAVHT